MDKKSSKVLLVLYLITIIFLLIGATYAFFSKIYVSDFNPSVEVESARTEFIVFDAGKDIRINPTKENFQEGMGNLFDNTFASAYIRVSENDRVVSHKYNLYFEIEDNNIEYSAPDKKPELLLTVTNPEGNVVKELNGLEFVEVDDDVYGFDITTAKGKYYIAQNYEISTKNEIMHKWNVKVTFVNLDSSQDANLDKILKGHLKIEKAG